MTAIILDTETTGLRQPEPVEIAYIHLPLQPESYMQQEHGLLSPDHTTFQSRYSVGKPIEPGATKIHGITEADIAGLPHWSTFQLPQVEFIIGHKIDYDAKVLGVPQAKYICTCNLSRLLWPELPNHKLTTVVEEKFPKMATSLTANAHGALVDCKLCLLILETAITEFEGLDTWQQMYELAGVAVAKAKPSANRPMTVMPFGKHKGAAIAEIPTDYLQWLATKADISDQRLLEAVQKELLTR